MTSSSSNFWPFKISIIKVPDELYVQAEGFDPYQLSPADSYSELCFYR